MLSLNGQKGALVQFIDLIGVGIMATASLAVIAGLLRQFLPRYRRRGN